MSNDCIRITGLAAKGFHGVFDLERQTGQVFVVDLVLYLAVDTETDDLSNTVDYSVVGGQIVNIIQGQPVNLIETLAGRIARHVLSYPRVQKVEVTVHKPQAPMGVQFGDVAVTISRRKE